MAFTRRGGLTHLCPGPRPELAVRLRPTCPVARRRQASAAPEPKRPAQLLGGLLRLGFAGFLDEVLEPVEIELPGGEPDHIAGRDVASARRRGRATCEAGNARLERAGVGLRGLLRPSASISLLDETTWFASSRSRARRPR